MTQIKKWKLLTEEDVSPSRWFPIFKHKVELPDGKVIDDYFVAKLGHVSMIVAVTPQREVLFVKQYKHGSLEVELELPAGRIGNHTPEEAAQMELIEETGVQAQELLELGVIHVEPSKMGIKVFGFLVKNAEITQQQNLDETENIEVVKVPIKDLDRKIVSGEIRVGSTLGVLRLAQLKHPRLFK